ncbi:MAG TPA: DUF1549 and DUF1553 domain-containing protein [Planctomycetota bacterium]|nr:DUF1549 and DUF1553 domain-containing protein [Planctomycetota bacterium]
MKREAWLAVVVIYAMHIANAAEGMSKEKAPPAPPIPPVVSIELQPPSLTLLNSRDERRVLVLGKTDDGNIVDLTDAATINKGGAEIADVAGDGYIQAKAKGDATFTVSAGGKETKLYVSVLGAETPPVRFVRDVMPVISRAGCNAGTCHGAAKGRNGFKLSLRGYDPDSDYEALINDLSGRRFDRVEPEKSLMLLKPLAEVPHEGKRVLKPDSRYYKILLAWISEGLKNEEVASARPVTIDILPKTIGFDLPGRSHRVLIVAKYSDGTTRDVTREAVIESSNKDVATVKDAVIRAERRGETSVLVRYEGLYASRLVTVMGDRNGYVWTEFPANNFIDDLVAAKLQKLKILPSELCSDAEFMRRVSLDLTGIPPTGEKVRAFLNDPTPSKQKREKLVDELIGNSDFVEQWSNKWADLLQCNSKALGEKAVWVFRDWIRQSIADNKPYDEFVRELLTAKGSSYHDPAVNYMRVLREPGKISEDVCQTFLGVRFNCNKCHDHPFEKWTQTQYYELGAYFARVNFKKGRLPGEEIVYRNTRAGEVSHLRTGKTMVPKVPFGEAKTPASDQDRREPFVDWLVTKDNPLFAKAIANRTWSYFFGVGIIEPVDDIRAGNPPSNPELLDALTAEVVKNNFDLRKLMRTICLSRTYQLSVAANKWNEDDKLNFSHAQPRRLSAEQLLDAVQVATGVRPNLPGLPAQLRAVEAPDGVVAGNEFLTLFGRPERSSSCECERSSNLSLGHTLSLINGPMIGDALANPANRIAKAAAEKDDAKVVEDVYLSVLCRLPTAAELKGEKLGEGKERMEAAQDLAWALMNSPAFIFNR